MLDGDPVVGCERFDCPSAAEPPDPGILFAAERVVGKVVHGLVVDVRHAGFEPSGEAHSSLEIAREHRTGKAVFRRIRNPQRVLVATGAQNRGDGAE